MNQITTTNPATGEEIAKYTSMEKEQVFQLVGKAKELFQNGKKIMKNVEVIFTIWLNI